MTYDVIISEVAEAEAEEAYFWLMGKLPNFAGRWYDGLLDAIASLDTFPNGHSYARENDDFPDMEVRQLIYRQGRTVYRVLYTVIEPNIVKVLHVRHASRQYGSSEE
jgi:plasmid stabilization system protein ParE